MSDNEETEELEEKVETGAGKKVKKEKRKFGKNAPKKGKKKDEEEEKPKNIDELLGVEELVISKDDVLNHVSVTGVLNSKPTDRDVKIGGFSLTLFGRELFQNTDLELSIGRRYGLIGDNGSGKSTLLRVLATRQVPIPDHMDIYHLSAEALPTEKSALEYVVEAAKNELKRLEAVEEELLSKYGPECELLEELYERIDSMDVSTFELRAGKLLEGLGFTKDMMFKHTCDMSGGWRMRVALAEALFKKPTLLLLDEPTNHLDLEACVWLENYLSKYDRCLVVVSHSADFMNGVCTNILHITEKRQFRVYSGNYDAFLNTKAENEVNQQKIYEKEQADIKHLKAFISSCGTYSNLVRQAKSKQKILDKMYEAGLTEPVKSKAKFSFSFAECEKLPPPVLTFSNVSFAYSGKWKDRLYSHLELGVDSDSRIALVGPNGAGKSTLLKLMCGDIEPIVDDKKDTGMIRRHGHLRIGRYHQHLEDLLDPELSPLDFMAKKYSSLGLEVEGWRSVIGRFGITGDAQTIPIKKLSDGYRSRVVFAMLATEKPNLLLLDEPTNHLDMECIDSLAKAINGYAGGLVLVSHDFRLIDQVAKQIWVCEDKHVTPWMHSIREYKTHLTNKMIKEGLI